MTALAPVSGFHEATLAKYMSNLRDAGLVPASGKGGGKSAVHLGNFHAAIVILALTAFGPGEAADAVRTLADLSWTDPQPGDFASLLSELALRIGSIADRIYRGEKPYTAAEFNNWKLHVCLDPVEAWVSWTEKGWELRRNYANPQPELSQMVSPGRGIRRLTIVNTEVLNTVGALCADTLHHQSKSPNASSSKRSSEN